MRHLTFGDPYFLNAVPHALATARAVHERCPALTFDITTKVEHILEHPSVLEELRGLGLLFIVTAVELMSAAVLRILDKGHAPDDARVALRLCRSLGIELRPSLLPFTPWTTLSDDSRTARFRPGRGPCRQRGPGAADHSPAGAGPIAAAGPAGDARTPPGRRCAQFSHTWRHPDPRMDELQNTLATVVARDADAGVDPCATHAAIRLVTAGAAAAAGLVWSGMCLARIGMDLRDRV